MLDDRLVYLTLLLNLAGTGHYARLVLTGRVRPNRASWVLWTVAPAVVLVAELSQGVGLRAVMTLSIVIGPLLVVVASFATRAAYWKLAPADWACAGLSGLAVLLWAVTDSADTAILLAIAADALAALPTLRKVMTDPDTEHPLFFVLTSLGGVVTLLTIDRWRFADWAFPAYIAVFPGLIAVLIWWRGREVTSATTSRAKT